MIYARQSTAIIVTVGPTLDADGVAVTGGVVGDFKISKNGGAPAALNASATYTHRHTGYGSLSLTASDVDTVGTAEITMDDTVNACPLKEIQVLEEAVYDALFAASATGYQIPIWSSAGATVNLSATTVKAVTDAVALPATATIAITGNITGNLSGSVGSVTGHTPQTGDSYAIVNSGTHGNAALKTLIDTVDTVVDAILVDTAEVGAAGAGLTALASAANLATTNQYAAEVHKATVAAAAVTVAASPSPTTTTFGSDRTEADDFWNDARIKFLTGSLTGQSRVVLDYANASGVFTLDEALTGTPSAGDTFILVSDHLHSITQIQSGLATAANLATLAGYVDTEVAAIKAKTDQLTFTVANQVDANALTVVGTVDDAVLSAIAALNNISAAQVNSEVDTALSDVGVTLARMGALTDWIDGGRLDLILDARASQASVDDLPTNAELATALGTADDATLAAIAALSIPSATTIADAVLSRNVSNVEASAGEHTLCTVALAMLESSISGTTWTIKRTNGSTTHATKTVTTDAAADPVTGVS